MIALALVVISALPISEIQYRDCLRERASATAGGSMRMALGAPLALGGIGGIAGGGAIMATGGNKTSAAISMAVGAAIATIGGSLLVYGDMATESALIADCRQITSGPTGGPPSGARDTKAP